MTTMTGSLAHHQVKLCVDVASTAVEAAEAALSSPSSSPSSAADTVQLATTTLQFATTFVKSRALPGHDGTRTALSRLEALRGRAEAAERYTAAATLTNLARHRPSPVTVTFSFFAPDLSSTKKPKRKHDAADTAAGQQNKRR